MYAPIRIMFKMNELNLYDIPFYILSQNIKEKS